MDLTSNNNHFQKQIVRTKLLNVIFNLWSASLELEKVREDERKQDGKTRANDTWNTKLISGEDADREMCRRDKLSYGITPYMMGKYRGKEEDIQNSLSTNIQMHAP